MSKPELEFKQVREDGTIPIYEKPIMSGFKDKEYCLRVPQGKTITVTTDEPCVIPLGVAAEIPEGWHVVFLDPPMTKSELSLGDNNEWILTITRQSYEASISMGSPVAIAMFAAAFIEAGLDFEQTKEELTKPRRRKDTFTLEGRITYCHLEEDE